jgi:acyl-CoA thioesterase I
MGKNSLLDRRHFNLLALASAGLGLSSPASFAQTKSAVILIVGDSLSAEYGLRRGTGWVALLEQKLAENKIRAKVINASISGDTTSGGRSRLETLLKQHQPTHVVIELGGNDALRGLPLSMTQANLSAMVEASQKVKAKPLLVGMQIPPNYGADYSAKFSAAFEAVAKQYKAPLVPFFLKGVADGTDALKMFQADRIHPKEEAHPIMLANVWPTLKKML